jgi:hypothetical protein
MRRRRCWRRRRAALAAACATRARLRAGAQSYTHGATTQALAFCSTCGNAGAVFFDNFLAAEI